MGEAPRQAIVMFALTELRLLSAIFGIESIIKKEPDVVLTVRDAAKAQVALVGAPGSLRVIDEKPVYLRMPPTYLEPETCLLVLKNLMRAAYDRQEKGLPAVPAKPAPPLPPKISVETIPAKATTEDDTPVRTDGEAERPRGGSGEEENAAKAGRFPPRRGQSPDYAKLVALHEAGILTDQEFQAALARIADEHQAIAIFWTVHIFRRWVTLRK